jgi:hypothetical protein
MRNLLEIAKIVTKKKIRKIEIFDDHSLKSKNNKFNEFYEGLLANRFRNDRDAAALLYQCSPTDDKYRQLKSRFKKRILNTLFFLDVNLPATSNYERAYFSCNKNWTLVKILQSNGAEFTAATLASQILTISLKFKFADMIVNSSRILRNYSARYEEEKEFEVYDEYCKQYQDILNAEIRSEELYQRVMIRYFEPPYENHELREKIDTYCDALVGLSEMYESPIVIYNMYLVWALRFEMLRDFESMLDVCSKAEKYIEENPVNYQADKLALFLMKKMSAYVHLSDYKNGRISAEKSLKAFLEGSESWFNFMETYFLLTMHTENYAHASAIYNKAISHPKFRQLRGSDKEKWRLFETYSYYFSGISGDQKRKGFNEAKFLSDPLVFTKEKKIFTIHFVIAQILMLIEKREYHHVTERIERLKLISNRQLKKEDNIRLISFIKLLQSLIKSDYVISEIGSIEKYYNRLVDNPFYYRGLISELEVIPYEKLWNFILSKLPKD